MRDFVMAKKPSALFGGGGLAAGLFCKKQKDTRINIYIYIFV
jgi:hypothetical protein